MRVALPPTDPPETRLIECPTCDGLGLIRIIEHGMITSEEECDRCEGLGEVDYDPDDNPYAPDTWKEAEGIA